MQIDAEGAETQPSVKLIMELNDDGSLVMTYADMDVADVYNTVIYLVDKLANMTGGTYNNVLNDLKEIEGEEV